MNYKRCNFFSLKDLKGRHPPFGVASLRDVSRSNPEKYGVAVITTAQVGSNPEIELFYTLFFWIASAYASQ
jgi:hypothetical protein